ncbi:excinuclease ABC subunit UvrA [Phaeocystidibacter luteus]|uniref:UvrABC system protein A n=1 Tax=Phaeocystidibacter luteus TaxID=911197 RepID=A0A6N6RMM7_9FLAO|nr:excinuclease ABC subunit UvrA [Phaeocystidibacter luteus]KAB2814831.1 excinuclease ABC subunit UvrA [Phaeocystidibacter luteus]
MSDTQTLTPETTTKHGQIDVYGARVHNLKNVDVSLPRRSLVVITGLSGSGKSSLAFDTLYAEGQRRYIETFSAYARQFLGGMERPDVDKIEGLSPVIAIEQKTTSKNPRSTVGTVTEIYDFLRLLFARAGTAYSYNTGEKMVSYTDDQIRQSLAERFAGKRIALLAPMVRSRKGHYRELFEQVARQGFVRARVDGELVEITKGMRLDRYKTHDIEIVVDRLQLEDPKDGRLQSSIGTAMYHGKGIMMVMDLDSDEVAYFSRHLMCPSTGIAYPDPEPNTFSFNSPKGACPTCNGLGKVQRVELGKVIPNPKISIKAGGLAPLGEYKRSWIFNQIEMIGEKFNFNLSTPIEDISEDGMDAILNGLETTFEVQSKTLGVTRKYRIDFEGILNFIESQYHDSKSKSIQRWADGFMESATCPECHGARLKKESLHFKVDDRNISELTLMPISDFAEWLQTAESGMSDNQRIIATEIIKELRDRTGFLMDVGLGYLSLDRPAKSLSGGEAQRIRLATQIGSQLVNVLYILDEPSIGLHQRDNHKLIDSLKRLRDVGNSVLVVEHDKDMIETADYILDIGPGAGVHGGHIVAEGKLENILESGSLTAEYLTGVKEVPIPSERRDGIGKSIKLFGAKGNNLKNVDIEIPLGTLTVVTGVSGSGKSTLINETLYPILSQHFYKSVKKPLPYDKIEGIGNIDKVIDIDQSPIGRTPRSNPSTYTGVFSDIRNLFAQLPEAKIRGYKPGRFSFNVKGGRCETCEGAGVRVIEMNFLPDVYVPCETCQGKRFNRETLEVRYKGKSISDVLNMSVEDALTFFEPIPKIKNKLKTLNDVGLGYITLGQQSTTLSGGEAQRVKLATELSKRDTGNTMYILDEPTTGLHFEDVRVLMEVLQKLVKRGNTILVIEHNMDVIKQADYIIDIGPDGGGAGGQVVATGTPEMIIENPDSLTGQFLKVEL